MQAQSPSPSAALLECIPSSAFIHTIVLNFVSRRSMIGTLRSDRGMNPSSNGSDDGPAPDVGRRGAIVRGRRRMADRLTADKEGLKE